MDKTFFDVRVFHDGNKSNSGPIDKVFQKHEAEKKRTYNSRVLEVEKSTFTPLVFSTSGSMGKEAEAFHKRIATLISNKRGTPYSDTISHIHAENSASQSSAQPSPPSEDTEEEQSNGATTRTATSTSYQDGLVICVDIMFIFSNCIVYNNFTL